jgi:dipeptidyl aminopeptidase/acylaminoacyl peptidase
MSASTMPPFGLWPSPITPASLAADRRLDGVAWDSDGATLCWLEGRSGKGVIVVKPAGPDAPRDLTGELSVRAEVGYGGGDFALHGGQAYFAVHKDGRLFRQALEVGPAKPLIPAFGKAAAPCISPDGKWLVYVHHDSEGVDRVALVDCLGKRWPTILAEGHDFYMKPQWSPDGRQLAFVAWDHPNMPWDETRLYVADVIVAEGDLPCLGQPRVVAGGPGVAVFQPEFGGGGELFYVSDETGWWRLARHDGSGPRWLTPERMEAGLPAWQQGMRTYALLDGGGTVIAALNQAGFQRLYILDVVSGAMSQLDELAAYTEIAHVTAASNGKRFAFIGSGPAIPPRVVTYDLSSRQAEVAARASGERIPADALATCEAVEWQTAGEEKAHGLFYTPPGRPAGDLPTLPPLIVLIHGGPTSQTRAGWRADAQFFATRGYAVLYVNYRGSTGYGRAYAQRLRNEWGVLDVEDAVSGARQLAAAGRVDPARRVIMGGSAGGYTVLQAMVNEPEAFTAGISLYGVANLFSLAADTHKFEARYLDSLVGPLPECAARYRERSPVNHASNIRRPLAVFQGEIDVVVPKAQAEEIVSALRKNGTPHVYHVYEGEGHGWRKAETIEHFYRTVDEFLKRYVLYS